MLFRQFIYEQYIYNVPALCGRTIARALRTAFVVSTCLLTTNCASMGMAPLLPLILTVYVVSLPILPFYYAKHGLPECGGAIEAAYSPDGQYVLALVQHEKRTRAYRKFCSGNEWELLSHGREHDANLAYSPDGSQIAFVTRAEAGSSNLFIMDADGSRARPLTSGKREDHGPQFSPDGNRMVFVSSPDGHQTDLWLINSDGTRLRQLTSDFASNDIAPLFLGDSRRIVFSRARYYGNYSPIAAPDWHEYGLRIIDCETGEETKLTESYAYEPSKLAAVDATDRILSESGNTFAITDPASMENIRASGVQYTLLREDGTNLREFEHCVASPDGTQVAFVLNVPTVTAADLYSVNVTDGESGRVQEVARIADEVVDVRFSPNGQELLLRILTYPTQTKTYVELWSVGVSGSGLQRIPLPESAGSDEKQDSDSIRISGVER